MTRPRARLFETFASLIVLVVFFGAVMFVAAPWQTFRSLRAAALAGDVRGVQSLIDTGALRESLRAERGWRPSPFSLGLGVPPPDVDGLMTPQAIAHFSHASPHQPGAPFRAGNLLPGLHDSRIRYWGPNRVQIAALAHGSDGRENVLTFERRGLFKWRLTAIHAP